MLRGNQDFLRWKLLSWLHVTLRDALTLISQLSISLSQKNVYFWSGCALFEAIACVLTYTHFNLEGHFRDEHAISLLEVLRETMCVWFIRAFLSLFSSISLVQSSSKYTDASSWIRLDLSVIMAPSAFFPCGLKVRGPPTSHLSVRVKTKRYDETDEILLRATGPGGTLSAPSRSLR